MPNIAEALDKRTKSGIVADENTQLASKSQSPYQPSINDTFQKGRNSKQEQGPSVSNRGASPLSQSLSGSFQLKEQKILTNG